MNNVFPLEYDPEIYLNSHPDLMEIGLNADNLKSHFDNYGKNEGRKCNEIDSRIDFVALIPANVSTLELGPFYNPVVRGENVKYFDVLNHEELVIRAQSIQAKVDNIPMIHFVDPNGNLDIINEKFDVIVSCHCIEHQPDFVSHLQKVEKLLKPGGFYFIIIPDKRYCFDYFIPETFLSDILFKHFIKAKTHSLKSVIEHRAFTTHNDTVLHWTGEHGMRYNENFEENVYDAVQEYNNSKGAYIDVHASQFTPDSFSEICLKLSDLELINLKIIRNYPTRKNQNEFFIIMENTIKL